jgi:hypothetical protein
MALQPRYTAVPAVPLVGIEEWQSQLLNAMKENIELLTGTRGEPDLASVAINRARLTVAVPPAQSMVQVGAQGSGVTISGANIPILEDYVQLITDVQKLANDVANLRATVEVLITQLRG